MPDRKRTERSNVDRLMIQQGPISARAPAAAASSRDNSYHSTVVSALSVRAVDDRTITSTHDDLVIVRRGIRSGTTRAPPQPA